jgi:hypothetical protein
MDALHQLRCPICWDQDLKKSSIKILSCSPKHFLCCRYNIRQLGRPLSARLYCTSKFSPQQMLQESCLKTRPFHAQARHFSSFIRIGEADSRIYVRCPLCRAEAVIEPQKRIYPTFPIMVAVVLISALVKHCLDRSQRTIRQNGAGAHERFHHKSRLQPQSRSTDRSRQDRTLARRSKM